MFLIFTIFRNIITWDHIYKQAKMINDRSIPHPSARVELSTLRTVRFRNLTLSCHKIMPFMYILSCMTFMVLNNSMLISLIKFKFIEENQSNSNHNSEKFYMLTISWVKYKKIKIAKTYISIKVLFLNSCICILYSLFHALDFGKVLRNGHYTNI